MNLYRFRPLGVKFLQLIKRRRESFDAALSKANLIRTIHWNISLSLGLSFLWPSKKDLEIKNEAAIDLSSTILQRADDLFENGHIDECYKLLRNVDPDMKDVEIQWRLCRVLYNMSKENICKDEERKKMINDAFIIISNQLQSNWNHFAVQKWYALLLDAKSTNEGIKERIMQLENVKKHMDLAVTLNPNDATTLHMLGEWCYQVADMPWHQRKIAEICFATIPQSTYEDALEYFLRAETAQPRFYSMNLLRLGNCYLKLQKGDQAKYYLNLAASYPAKSNDDHQANKEATELLKKLK